MPSILLASAANDHVTWPDAAVLIAFFIVTFGVLALMVWKS